MRFLIFLAFFIAFGSLSTVTAQAPADFSFEDFQSNAEPKLPSDLDLNWDYGRTIKWASENLPNFSDNKNLIVVSIGAGFQAGYLYDRASGDVLRTFPPEMEIIDDEWVGEEGLAALNIKSRLGSNLAKLVHVERDFDAPLDDEGRNQQFCVYEDYLWTGDKFVLLGRTKTSYWEFNSGCEFNVSQ